MWSSDADRRLFAPKDSAFGLRGFKKLKGRKGPKGKKGHQDRNTKDCSEIQQQKAKPFAFLCAFAFKSYICPRESKEGEASLCPLWLCGSGVKKTARLQRIYFSECLKLNSATFKKGGYPFVRYSG